MTTAADDSADEAAFEAFLAGRPAPEGMDGGSPAVTAFAGAVRATATLPGRPNSALAELLATGLLMDQSSPSTRTAPSAGSPPRRSRVRRRRRFAMFFPALLAKFLSAGAVAQAATGAGICVVAFTGAGAAGVLPGPVQETFSSVVGVASDEETTPDDTLPTGDTLTTGDTPTTDPAETATPAVETTVPVEAELDPEAWIEKGPEGYPSFGAWVTASSHNSDLRDWLRGQGRNFGSLVSDWAHKKGLSDEDLADEGVDLDELSEDSTSGSVPGETEVEPETEVGSTDRGDDRGGNRGNGGGNRGSNAGGGKAGGGNGNGGRGHN